MDFAIEEQQNPTPPLHNKLYLFIKVFILAKAVKYF